MKLLVAIPYFPPFMGGMEKHVKTILDGLKKEYKWDIVVVTSNHESKEYKEEIIDGIRIYRLPIQFKISNTPISLKWKNQIRKIVEKENPDVINGRGPVPYISDVASSIAKEKGIPFVLGWHFPSMKKGIIYYDVLISIYENIFLKRMANNSKEIICSSDYAKETLFSNFKDKSTTINQGINKKVFKPINLKKKSDILFVGNFSTEIKGLSYLLESLIEIKKKYPKTILTIAGEGNLKYYKNLIEKFDIVDNVRFTGKLNPNDLSKEYNQTKIFVLPSTNENFPSTMLEAMLCKTPVIATKISEIPRLIKSGHNGILINPRSPKEISDNVINLLKNENLRKDIGIKGYNSVKNKFFWIDSIRKTNGVLTEVINKNG